MANQPSEYERIEHMIEAVDKILNYTEDVGYEEFLKDEMRKDAVIKNFEVIGEAAYKLSAEFKDKYPNIAWNKIQGLRHVLVHDYYRVNPEILWNTKEQYIEALRVDLEEIKSDLDDEK
jgi:uncharacterized protein with HEPN domain